MTENFAEKMEDGFLSIVADKEKLIKELRRLEKENKKLKKKFFIKRKELFSI